MKNYVNVPISNKVLIIIITIIIIVIKIIKIITTKPRSIIAKVNQKNQIYSTYPMFIFFCPLKACLKIKKKTLDMSNNNNNDNNNKNYNNDKKYAIEHI